MNVMDLYEAIGMCYGKHEIQLNGTTGKRDMIIAHHHW